MANKTIIKILIQNGLKVTPQRTAILETVLTLDYHPTAENIIETLRITQPHLSMGTVYKTLETLSSKGIITKIYTESDIVRYDNSSSNHHHLYSSENGRIDDYYDDNLFELIKNYFENKSIPGFFVKDVKLQIIGQDSSAHHG